MRAQLPELQEDYEKNIITLAELEDQYSSEKSNEQNSELLLKMARVAFQVGYHQKCANYFMEINSNGLMEMGDFRILSISLFVDKRFALSKEIWEIYQSKLNKEQQLVFQELWQQVRNENTHLPLDSNNTLSGMYLGLNAAENGQSVVVKDRETFITQGICNGKFLQINAAQLPIDGKEIGSACLLTSDNSYIISARENGGNFNLYRYAKTKNGNKWKKPTKLNAGNNSANNVFPYFYKNKLYFTSDRPGGSGGFDIYFADLEKKGLKNIENIGSTINTSQNEIYPNWSNGTFHFSSNGHFGLGGYDVYSSNSSFNQLKHLPAPINSSLNEWNVVVQGDEDLLVLKDYANGARILHFSAKTEATDVGKTVKGVVLDYLDYPIKHNAVYAYQSPDNGVYTMSKEDGTFTFNDLKGSFLILETRNLNYASVIDTILFEESKGEYESILKFSNSPAIVKNSATTEINTAEEPSKSEVNSSDVDEEQRNDDIYSQSREYIAVIGGANNFDAANELFKEWSKKFKNLRIYHFPEKSLYRVGIPLTQDRTSSLPLYYDYKKTKADIWLLAP
jgi:hypothetical protein